MDVGKMILRLISALAFGACAVAATPALAATSCTPGRFTVGDCDQTIGWGGRTRTFHVHVPTSYTGTVAKPLVLDLHGIWSTGLEQRDRSGQKQQSDKRGFIVVYPEGVDKSWNGLDCCGTGKDQNIDDVGFLREVIRTMKTWGPIDTNRVYVTGLSNGGSMTHRMACEASDIVRAVAPVSFPLNRPERCHPAHEISVTEFRGTGDWVVPYKGNNDTQSATESQASWRKIDGCSDAHTTTTITAKAKDVTYTGCGRNTKVGLVTITDGDHVLYTTKEMNIADYIWTHVFNQ